MRKRRCPECGTLIVDGGNCPNCSTYPEPELIRSGRPRKQRKQTEPLKKDSEQKKQQTQLF